MGKIAARIYDPDDSLLAKTLSSKYSRLDLHQQSRKHSKMWKIIKLGANIVDNHATWMIGDGLRVSVQNDNWIGPSPIAKWPTFVSMTMIPLQVSHFLDNTHNWNFQSLQSCVGNMLAATISLLPRENQGGGDKLIWNHTENQRMKAASIYSEESCEPNLVGNEIWKLRTQPRILMTIWRAAKKILPTNFWLRDHHLRDNASCPWGYLGEETIPHVFGDCKFFKSVWKECSRIISLGPVTTFNNMLDNIFSEIAESRNSPKAVQLACIIYHVWIARNCMIHGQPYKQPATIAKLCIFDSTQGPWDVPNNFQSCWTPPPWLDQSKFWWVGVRQS